MSAQSQVAQKFPDLPLQFLSFAALAQGTAFCNLYVLPGVL